MVETNIQDDILLVKLNRPNKRNALNDAIILALEKIFAQVPATVKCAIVYGEGQHFSAGLDLSELQERDAVQGLMHSRSWHRALDAIQFGKVPVIAVLHGACVGGGLELASACHIRVAESSTFYALPEGQRGIFVGGGASVRVPKLIGLARMTDMMLTGRVYRAEEGERVGLAQYLVAEGEGLAKAIELAHKIGANAPMTNYALMHILPKITDSTQEVGMMMESLTAAIAQNAPEAKSRLQDFLDGKAKKVGE
ncbi:MAG TPA: crotonase/enoyl-CoA hydratase family protein [Haliscomenobacter sp.]|uniref:crotonase/enoyl-CoA hydratase family protein n=1 Tax=Haliscomenobacter sp. TaxID=2717303 RepID=UPI001D3C8924|nr:crotonase/enoyl-CoA hydratase family protein [Haliscomenobacter sp.]MBK9490136.1 crotonase/enoyl-CoA hydratase family protein [Haliscomenobacter sp.]HOY20041.1 crotonase/enoyl-CoA hydratase family protein [Haliscomenobacter sp.]